MRYAAITVPSGRQEEVEAYLPRAYKVVGAYAGDRACTFVIEGEDQAGWSLDAYVLPRLASGLLFGQEITERMAHCRCGKIIPSSKVSRDMLIDRGPGSDYTKGCECGYNHVAHTKEGMANNVPSNRRTVIERGHCSGFVERGPAPTDAYYCGCRGWD